MAGCDPAPSASPGASGTPATSAPAGKPTVAGETGNSGADALKPGGSGLSAGDTAGTQPALSDSPTSPVEVKFTLPPFDVSSKPQPVRMAYNELKRGVESKHAPLQEALTIAALHYVHGSPADAAKVLAQVAAAQPSHAMTRHMWGLSLERAGAMDDALKAYESAAALEPAFAPAQLRIGILLIEKDPPRSRQAFEKTIELDPADAIPHLGLAKILRAEKKNDEAYRKCLDALRRFPAYAEAHKEAAELGGVLGKSAEAEMHKQRAALGALPPNSDPILARMMLFGLDLRRVVQEGLAYADAGDFKTAEEFLLKAIPLDTEGTTAQRAMASLKVKAGKLDEAASMLRPLVDANPKDASSLFQYADVLARQGRTKEALEAFAKVAELAPKDARVPFTMGGVHFAAGNLDDAKKLWKTAIELAPVYEDAYIRLAELASKQKDYAEYVRVLKAGLEQIPESPLLANGLAWVYSTCPDEKHRNGAEAVKLAEGAVQATGNRMHEFIDTLACAYAEVGRFEDAVKRIDEAASMASDPSQKIFLDQYKGRQTLFREKKPFRDG